MFEIRAMLESDDMAVSRVVAECYRHIAGPDRITPAQLDRLIAERCQPEHMTANRMRHTCHVAVVQGAVAGYVASSGCAIEELFVHPDHHRRGIGAALFRRAESECRGPTLRVCTTGSGTPFYQAMGMRVAGKRLVTFGPLEGNELTQLEKKKSGRVIFLNGVSSSGKSSLAKELQRRLPEPFLHFRLDAFIEMLPRLDDAALFMRMANGMHRSIAAMAEAGNNLIVDHVVVEKEWLEECLEFLARCSVLFVGLHCPLEELERRERGRDARRQGFARAQLVKIHTDKVYDVEVDTHALSVAECADRVLEFHATKQPTAFDRMRAAARAGATI